MEEQQARPPYVRFEIRAVEDRTRSIEEGKYVAKDVIFALVTPMGTKDVLEKEADEWIKGIEEGVKQERIPPHWLTQYRMALENFKNDQNDPETGTSINNWNAITPAQRSLMLDCGIRTIEDVAAINEEAVQRIGMGARALKAKAQAWLDSADQGKVAAELEALRQENGELKARNEELDTRLAKLEKEEAKTEA